MRIIISPAKKMKVNTDTVECGGLPVFIKDAEVILEWMRQLSYEQAKKLWACNDQIAGLNYERFAHMDLYRSLTPAILSYEGIAYQYMAPGVFEYGQFDYVQEHLRILSGFYGVLKPLDGVTPYRLEMQAGAGIAGFLSALFKCTLMAPHGGVFVFATVGQPVLYIVAWFIGSVVTAVLLGLIKKDVQERK